MSSSHFHLPSTLQLEVDIEVADGRIIRSGLKRSASEGISCQVQGASPELLNEIQLWLEDYGAGKQPAVRLPLSLEGLPPFISHVLLALHEVPFGETLSYGELAAQLFRPKAARAVGQACGRNPLILFIPCHRVLAANRKLGGFSADPSLKPLLLAHESVYLA